MPVESPSNRDGAAPAAPLLEKIVIEFPKMLYMGGDASAEYRIVNGAEEEAEARAEGFAMAGEDEAGAEVKPRRGRPPKASE